MKGAKENARNDLAVNLFAKKFTGCYVSRTTMDIKGHWSNFKLPQKNILSTAKCHREDTNMKLSLG